MLGTSKAHWRGMSALSGILPRFAPGDLRLFAPTKHETPKPARKTRDPLQNMQLYRHMRLQTTVSLALSLNPPKTTGALSKTESKEGRRFPICTEARKGRGAPGHTHQMARGHVRLRPVDLPVRADVAVVVAPQERNPRRQRLGISGSGFLGQSVGFLLRV